MGPATARATGGVEWMNVVDDSSLGGLVETAAGGWLDWTGGDAKLGEGGGFLMSIFLSFNIWQDGTFRKRLSVVGITSAL